MKRLFALLLTTAMILAMFAGCGTQGTTANTGKADGSAAPEKTAVEKIGICIPKNAEYFGYIAGRIKDKMDQMGVAVEIMSAEDDGQLMLTQIQNFTVSGVDALYIFPAGDATAFHDVVKEATDSGIKTVVSHNSTGEGTATATIRCEELYMGMMMSAMTNEWVNENYPDAPDGSVKVLVLENSLIPDMIKRSTGMKLVAERFLRQVDMKTGKFVKTAGPEVTYLAESGTEVKVDEPTGGLVLDDAGHAILNPYYNPKVKIIEISNRTIGSNLDAQNALDIVFVENNGENADIKVVCCYAGDAAVGASEKLLSMIEDGTIQDDPSKLAVFGADITPDNIERIKQSADNSTLFRGVMTNGDIVGSIVDTIAALVEGKAVEEDRWEPIGYMVLNDAGTDVEQVLYDGSLPAAAEFIAN